MSIVLNSVTLPAPQTYARSPVVRHVDYVSLNEHVLRDKAAGVKAWSYVLGWEALTVDEFSLIKSAWEAVIAAEGTTGLSFVDLTNVSYSLWLESDQSEAFSYVMYSGRVSTNPTYDTLYDCGLTFRVKALS